MTNNVALDETARYEPSHLDLHCLHRYLIWSARLKGLTDQTSVSEGGRKQIYLVIYILKETCLTSS